jgi:hypothetical protein
MLKVRGPLRSNLPVSRELFSGGLDGLRRCCSSCSKAIDVLSYRSSTGPHSDEDLEQICGSKVFAPGQIHRMQWPSPSAWLNLGHEGM